MTVDTGAATLAADRALVVSSRRPAMAVGVQIGKSALRSGGWWGIVFGLYVAIQVLAYTSAYKTPLAREQMALAYSGNVGLNALFGQAHAINTVDGYASWRLVGILGLLGAVWGMLTSTRLLRGEEEAGRYELLVAGQTTLQRAAAQALASLGAGWIALFAFTALGTVATGRAPSVGFTTGQSLYFALVLASSAAVFLALGALASQLAGTRRRALSITGAVFGVFFAVRMVGDTEPGLHWMVWLSPLGWIEQAKPLTGPRPLALLPAWLLVIAATAVAIHLSGARDLGSATLAEHNPVRPRLALLGGTAGLAVRLARPSALAWLAGIAAFSLLLGTIAESSTRDVGGDTAIEQAMARLGGHGTLVEAYLGLTFLIIALMIAFIAAGQITAIRAEEADGHLENLLVRPVGRIRWLAERLGLATALVVAAAVLAGACAWAGVAAEHGTASLGALTEAGLNIVAPALVILGLGTLTFGARPRSVPAVVYGYLAYSFLVELLGAVVKANHWLMDTAAFFHMTPAPATSPNWTSAAVMTGLGLAMAVLGAALLRRRDVRGA
jgi:ABC-2 type transport system permease protein